MTGRLMQTVEGLGEMVIATHRLGPYGLVLWHAARERFAVDIPQDASPLMPHELIRLAAGYLRLTLVRPERV